MNRGPLRLTLAAFAASALVIVLQTVVHQLLPYYSPSSDEVAFGLRAAFLLADIAMLVAFVSFARAEPRERGLLVMGAALSGLSVLAGMAGIAAKLVDFPSVKNGLFQASRAAGAAELATSIGTALLATLALAGLARAQTTKVASRARRVLIAVSMLAGLALLFRLARLFETQQRSLVSAWVTWTIDLARPALVAFLALLLLHDRRTAPTEAQGESPYRAAGERPAGSVERKPCDEDTAAALRGVAQALAGYRRVFLGHLAGATATTLLAIPLAFVRHPGEGALLAALVPVASLVGSALLVRKLFELLALPRAVRARGAIGLAIAALGCGVLVNLACIILLLIAFSSGSALRASRQIVSIVFAGWPVVALASGVSLVFVATALRRLGEHLADEGVARCARWVEAGVIGAGALLVGAALSVVVADSSRSEGSFVGTASVTLTLLFAAFASALLAIIRHVVLVGAARQAILEAIEPPHAR